MIYNTILVPSTHSQPINNKVPARAKSLIESLKHIINKIEKMVTIVNNKLSKMTPNRLRMSPNIQNSKN
jgi:hypothetical protein